MGAGEKTYCPFLFSSVYSIVCNSLVISGANVYVSKANLLVTDNQVQGLYLVYFIFNPHPRICVLILEREEKRERERH